MDSNHQSRSGKGLAFFETTLIDLRPLHLRGKQLTSTSGTFTTFEPGIFARYGTGVRTRIWKKPWRSSGPSWLS